MTNREKRTLRRAGIGISAYLAIFLGFKGYLRMEAIRADYDRLARTAQTLRFEVEPYQTRAARLQRLMERLQLDPGRITTNTAVGQTSAAIQRAATAGGLQLGPIRESVGRSSERELGAIQFDATGQSPAVFAFLARINTLGFPIVVESVQLTPEPQGPGMVKLHLTITILDYEQWKLREASHA